MSTCPTGTMGIDYGSEHLCPMPLIKAAGEIRSAARGDLVLDFHHVLK